ncbi:MAG: transporter ATP-binding protein [Bacteroidetes bacterium]|nr:transporter ATP-binding protein [Bacteroidota bacterium]
MPALIMGKKLAQVKPRAGELLQEIGLEGKEGQKPTKLSGGEQQRVAVARALMNAPRVVLADEPTGNLDTANAQLLHDLLWDLSRKLETTFIVVTHNESLAKKADRVVRIQDGVIQTS